MTTEETEAAKDRRGRDPEVDQNLQEGPEVDRDPRIGVRFAAAARTLFKILTLNCWISLHALLGKVQISVRCNSKN